MEDVHKLKAQDGLEKNAMNNSTSMNDQPEDREQNDSKKRQPRKDGAQNDSKRRQPKDGAQNDGKQNKCASEQDELYPYSMYPGVP